MVSPCSFSSFSFSFSSFSFFRSVPEKSALGWWINQLLSGKRLTLKLTFDLDLWTRHLTSNFDLYIDLSSKKQLYPVPGESALGWLMTRYIWHWPMTSTLTYEVKENLIIRISLYQHWWHLRSLWPQSTSLSITHRQTLFNIQCGQLEEEYE